MAAPDPNKSTVPARPSSNLNPGVRPSHPSNPESHPVTQPADQDITGAIPPLPARLQLRQSRGTTPTTPSPLATPPRSTSPSYSGFLASSITSAPSEGPEKGSGVNMTWTYGPGSSATAVSAGASTSASANANTSKPGPRNPIFLQPTPKASNTDLRSTLTSSSGATSGSGASAKATNEQSLADLLAEKHATLALKIPTEWRLPSALLSSLPSPLLTQPATPFSAPLSASSPLTPASSYPPAAVTHIVRESGILSESELAITERYGAGELVKKMAKGELRCEEVVTAFCKRAAVAHQCTNCLTEIMFEEAIEKARVVDRWFVTMGGPASGATLGGLHGLPVSLKDSFNLEGVPTTIGYVCRLRAPPAAHNSTLVSLLRDQGAIFYCKTNLPQTMMTADTHNNIFGRTLNPHNLSLTAGGSTGGEGALLAMRGSVLGMTTDIAGSTRIPALCNGLVGLKPTAGRIPFGGGVPPGRLGSPSAIAPAIGALAHSVADIELFMRTAVDAEPWTYDENVLAVPWRRLKPMSRPLRIGVLHGHMKRPLHPPIQRALVTAEQKLRNAGHETILLGQDEIPDLWDAAVLAWKYFLLDPAKTAAQRVAEGEEEWVPSIATAKFPELEGWEASLDELFDMNVARAGIVKAWHKIMVEMKLDAVMMPGYQATAVSHDTYGVPIYTVLQNLLNYPAGMLPFLKADKKEDERFCDAQAAYEPPYEADKVEGMPAAVQIMGKPMKDEELVEVMKVVESVLHGTDAPAASKVKRDSIMEKIEAPLPN